MNVFDTETFNEEVLKHLIMCPDVLKKAQDLKLQPTDFLSSVIAGVRLYEIMATAIFEIGVAPISRNILDLEVKSQIAKTNLAYDAGDLEELYNWIYKDILTPTRIIGQLHPFIKHRRVRKATESNKVDPIKLAEEISKIAISLDEDKATSAAVSASPFAAPILSTVVNGISTGFDAIDAKIHGLSKEECGLIIGHSGSGKTAVTAAMARMCALNGYKALFISLEEPYQNIVHRWYAAQFQMEYTRLHYGGGDTGALKLDLELCFKEMDPVTRETLANLQIIDARALCPINKNGLVALLEQKAEEGFIPDVVFIDQLDYVSPLAPLPKGASPWQEYEEAAFDLDALSQYKIKGVHTFALWVVHQGKGGMKWEFGYDDISGFRGIVKPFDICLGVGRHTKEEPYINLFTMKVRHTEHIKQSYKADFKYMSFIQEPWSPALQKKADKEASKDETEKLTRVNPRLMSPAAQFKQKNGQDS